MINLFHSASPLCNRKKVEEKLKAKFVLQSQFVGSGGTLSQQPADIFYVAEPDRSKGHDHYFGIFPDCAYGTSFMITAVRPELVVHGLLIEDIFAYSSYGHDFVTHPNESTAFMDGGRNYSRGNPEYPMNAFIFLEPTGPEMMVEQEASWWYPVPEVNWGAK